MLRAKIYTANTLKRQSKTKVLSNIILSFFIIQKYIKKVFIYIISHAQTKNYYFIKSYFRVEDIIQKIFQNAYFF